MSEAVPSIGRIVHYVSHGSPVREDGTQEYTSECRAAVVTAVATMTVRGKSGVSYYPSLCVLNPTGLFFHDEVRQDEGDQHAGGTWHWPERV